MPKGKKPFEVSEMADVARLYHHELMDVTAIAGELHLDRRKVDELLEEIRRQGLVSIAPPMAVDEGLERELHQRFNLLKVKIVPSPPISTPQQYADLIRRWGHYCADYFEELAAVTEKQTTAQRALKLDTKPLKVGISGGETLFEFVNSVVEQRRPDVEIYTTALVGRGYLPRHTSHIDPIVNATTLWSKCGRCGDSCRYVTVPPYPELSGSDWQKIRQVIDRELRNLQERSSIKEMIEAMDNLDVAFVGLGVVKPDATDPAHLNRLTMMSLLKPVSRGIPRFLHEQKAVGDIGYCLFDKDGVTAPEWRFFLTAGHYDSRDVFRDAGFFKKMVEANKPVVVMAGIYKEPAILVALQAGLFNVWFTDETAARTIIEMHDATRKSA